MSIANAGQLGADLEAAIQSAWEASKKANAERPMSFEEANPDPYCQAINEAWAMSGVPKIFSGVPDADSWGWAYISGPVGVGKSHLACQMLRRFIDETCTDVIPGQLWNRPRGYFCTAQEYLERVKDAFGSDDDRAMRWREAELLVVDDLGQEQPTSWAVSQLYDLVNHRYEQGLPTIFTSQYPISGIEGRLSEGGNREQAKAIASRLVGTCRSIRLEGVDRRMVQVTKPQAPKETPIEDRRLCQ